MRRRRVELGEKRLDVGVRLSRASANEFAPHPLVRHRLIGEAERLPSYLIVVQQLDGPLEPVSDVAGSLERRSGDVGKTSHVGLLLNARGLVVEPTSVSLDYRPKRPHEIVRTKIRTSEARHVEHETRHLGGVPGSDHVHVCGWEAGSAQAPGSCLADAHVRLYGALASDAVQTVCPVLER